MAKAIVIGASSSIAQCIIEQLLNDHDIDQLVAVSRTANPALESRFGSALKWLCCDYREASIQDLCARLGATENHFSHVVICNGLLHSESLAPEKRLEDIDAKSLQAVFLANSIIPMLWLSNLTPLLKSKQECSVAVFSARVGSIEDNRSGGWYAYRASKSALNMLIKTASLELKRRAPNVKIFAFHPGTTDTALSKPFQANVPEGKLFSPDFVARRLLDIMKKQGRDNDTQFIDWAGKAISW